MSKIKNIGVLDVRNIKEEIGQTISEISNIGMVIESDKSQLLLKHVKRSNIGNTLILPDNVKLIMTNGKLVIDNDYLEGMVNPVVLLINGKLVIEDDVDIKLLDEKIHSFLINGKIVCPKKLAGLISSKGTINGLIQSYTSGYKFIQGQTNLTNRFLKSLKPGSKVSFERLMVLEDLDMDLFREKICHMEVIGKITLKEELEEVLAQYIKDYFSLKKIVIPNQGKEITFIDIDLKLDDNSIKDFSGEVLFVDGDVEIYLENSQAEDIFNYLYGDKLTTNQETYDLIRDKIDKDVEIEIIEGKLLANNGKLVFSGDLQDYEEELTLINKGKLILDENLDFDRFNEIVKIIDNFGLIQAPEDKISLVRNKIRKNFGKLDKICEKKVEEKKEEEDVLYANLGELRL